MEFKIREEDRFPSKVAALCRLKQASALIREELEKLNCLEQFRNSCFGRFLDIQGPKNHPQLIHNVLLRQVRARTDEIEGRMVFNLCGKRAIFSIREFNLITGLRCSPMPELEPSPEPGLPTIVDTVFEGKSLITCNELEEKFIACNEAGTKLMLALVYFVEVVLLGKETKLCIDLNWMELVQDLAKFNEFPWGTLSFTRTLEGLQGALVGRAEKFKQKGLKIDFYSLVGFPYAFQIWTYEAVPQLGGCFALRVGDLHPRMLRWTPTTSPKPAAVNYVVDMDDLEVNVNLVPSVAETEQEYTLHNDDIVPISVKQPVFKIPKRIQPKGVPQSRTLPKDRKNEDNLICTNVYDVAVEEIGRVIHENLSAMEKRLDQKLEGRGRRILKKMEDMNADIQDLVRGRVKDDVVKKKVVAEHKKVGKRKVVEKKGAQKMKGKQQYIPKDSKKSRTIPTTEMFQRRVSPRFARQHSAEPNLREIRESLRSMKKIKVAMREKADESNDAEKEEKRKKESDDIVQGVSKDVQMEAEKGADNVEGGDDLLNKNDDQINAENVEVVAEEGAKVHNEGDADEEGAASVGPKVGDGGDDNKGHAVSSPSTDLVVYNSPAPLAVDTSLLTPSPELSEFLRKAGIPGEPAKRVVRTSKYHMSPYTDPTSKRPKLSTEIPKEFNPLRELDAELEEQFSSFYNRITEQQYFELPTCSVDKKWWSDLLSEESWLIDSHLDTAIYYMLARKAKYPNLFAKKCHIMDTTFGAYLTERSKLYQKNPDPKHWDKDNRLYNFVSGSGRHVSWTGLERVYIPFNLKGDHWIAVMVDLKGREITAFDSLKSHTRAPKFNSEMEPFRSLLPRVLKLAGTISGDNDDPWRVERASYVPQQLNGSDCGVFCIRCIELLSSDIPLSVLKPSEMRAYRKLIAVENWLGQWGC